MATIWFNDTSPQVLSSIWYMILPNTSIFGLYFMGSRAGEGACLEKAFTTRDQGYVRPE